MQYQKHQKHLEINLFDAFPYGQYSAIRENQRKALEVIKKEGGSVTLEKGDVSTDGSSIKLYITIDTLDAAEPFDTAGSRVIKVRTPDGLKELTLKVIGEKVQSPEADSP